MYKIYVFIKLHLLLQLSLMSMKACGALGMKVVVTTLIIHIFSFQLLFTLFLFLSGVANLINPKTFLVILFFILGWMKIFLHRNHLMNYLIMIEFNMILMYYSFMVKISVLSSSTTSVFFFMVVMVCGACVGMSLLVMLTRMMNKELELVNTSLMSN